jgi:hypothetical protein
MKQQFLHENKKASIRSYTYLRLFVLFIAPMGFKSLFYPLLLLPPPPDEVEGLDPPPLERGALDPPLGRLKLWGREGAALLRAL